ncbi:hypothetical protein Tco_0252303 [Tanacetum coccineum]
MTTLADKSLLSGGDNKPPMQNVENSFSGSNEQYAEIERLKQTLSEQVQEKDSLMKTVSDLKNDLQMEENRNIDREIALEKKIKQLDNIIHLSQGLPTEINALVSPTSCGKGSWETD